MWNSNEIGIQVGRQLGARVFGKTKFTTGL